MKIIAYVIYILAMAVSGGVMGLSGFSFKTWQYWAMLVCLLIVYTCGYIRGGY